MRNAPKREKREKKLLVKEEIGGESIAKPVFQIKALEKKKNKITMNADISKQTMEMEREIDAVAMIHGGGGDDNGRN